MGIILRTILYIICIGLTIWIGWTVYTTTFNLLSFQIELYSYILQGQEVINTAGAKAQGVVNTIVGFFSDTEPTTDLTTGIDYEERLQAFSRTLETLAGIIGILAGAITYFVSTKILFGVRKHLQSLLNFIK